MKSILCLCMALLSIVPGLSSASQETAARRGLRDTFIDGAVDSKGNTWILRHSGLKRTSPDGVAATVEVWEGLADAFDSFGYQALSVDDVQGVAVLWSGRKGDSVESVVTLIDSRRNVQLKPPVSFAIALSMAPDQDIYVFGSSLSQESQRLVHRYSRDGLHLGSFNPFLIGNPGAPAERHKLGRSRVAAVGEGVFVLSPLFDSRVFRCFNGNVVQTVDFGTVSAEGLKRRPVTMFSKDRRVYVQVFVSGPSDLARHELYVYENGDFRLAFTTKDAFGQVLGLKADGQIVTRDVTVTAARDSIVTKVP